MENVNVSDTNSFIRYNGFTLTIVGIGVGGVAISQLVFRLFHLLLFFP